MAFLMFDHMLGYPDRHPDVDVELQGHGDLRDGEGLVCGIRLSRLPADTGVGQEIGIALRALARSQGRHIGWRRGRVKRAVRDRNRLLVDCRHRSFPMLPPRREAPPREPA